MKRAAAALLTIAMTPAHAAESLPASLDELSAAIVARVVEDGGATIAVSTLTHGDGACSDLSNFASELLVGSLYAAGEGRARIIERSQLAAIFREEKLVYDGTIAPDNARRLGEIEGVDAIVVGSMTRFGEEIMILSRLIGTQDGGVIASAVSSFPYTDSVRAMTAERSGARCGFDRPAANAAATPTAASIGGTTQPAIATASVVHSSALFDAQVTTLTYSADSGRMTAAIRFTNTGEKALTIGYMSGSMAIADGYGAMMTPGETFSGLRVCTNLSYCDARYPQNVSTIGAGKTAQANFDAEGAKGLASPRLTITFEVVTLGEIDGESAKRVESVGFFDLAPTTR